MNTHTRMYVRVYECVSVKKKNYVCVCLCLCGLQNLQPTDVSDFSDICVFPQLTSHTQRTRR